MAKPSMLGSAPRPSSEFGKSPVLNEGQLDTAFDHSHRDGIAGEAGDVVAVEPLHECLLVLFDRFDTDAEFPSGFTVNRRPGLVRTPAFIFPLQIPP